MTGDSGHEDLAGAHQAFFVGKGDTRAPLHRGQGRFQAGGADNGGHDPVGVEAGRVADGFFAGGDGDAGPGQRRLEQAVAGDVGQRHHFGLQGLGLRRELFPIAVGGQRNHPISVTVAVHQVDGGFSHRSRRSEDCQPPHLISPAVRPARIF